jgi:tetratricopeptide (TPR) repeat protein
MPHTIRRILIITAIAIVPGRSVAQGLTIRGVVESDGRRLRGVVVRVAHTTETTTTRSGEFIMRLPHQYRPGDPISIHVRGGGGEWIITSPWRGEALVPGPQAQLRIQVLPRGDLRLLGQPEFLERIAAQIPRPPASVDDQRDSRSSSDAALAQIASELGLPAEALAQAVQNWGRTVEGPYHRGLAAQLRGEHEEATRLLRQSVQGAREDLIERYLALSGAEYWSGDLAASERTLREASAAAPQDTEVLHYLAVVLKAQDKWAAADSVFRRAIPLLERRFGPEAAEVGGEFHNWSITLLALGDTTAAVTRARQAVSIAEARHGDDLESASALYNLGLVLSIADQSRAADSALVRALQIRRRILGKDHYEVMRAVRELARVRADYGEYTSADSLFELAIRQREEGDLGPNHPWVAHMLTELADVRAARGRWGDAERLYERAVSIREAALADSAATEMVPPLDGARLYVSGDGSILHTTAGIDSAQAISTLIRSGIVLSLRGNDTVAEKRFRRALELEEKGTRSILLGGPSYWVGLSLSLQGRFAEADPFFARARRAWEASGFSPDSNRSVSLLHFLHAGAEGARAHGESEAAEELLLTALAALASSFIYDQPSDYSIMSNLATAQAHRGNYDQAESNFRDLLEAKRSSLPPDHPGITLTEQALRRVLCMRQHSNSPPTGAPDSQQSSCDQP